MPSPAELLDQESWHGGFYELAIELGPRDDARLQTALDALWFAAGITDPVAVEWKLEPRSWPIPRTVASIDAGHHLRGTVLLPSESRCVCSVIGVRLDYNGVDWLDFCLPTAALGALEPRVRGYPIGDDGGAESLVWRRPIDDWLADIARQVLRQARFRLP